MGWIAYRLKRIKISDNSEIGEITVYFPKVSVPIELPNNGKELGIEQLVSISDFPVEATVFAPYKDGLSVLDDLRKYGFGNAIDTQEYIGEKWVLNNGNYIQFVGIENRIYISYVRNSDSTILHEYPVHINNANTFCWIGIPMCIVGDNSESWYGDIVYGMAYPAKVNVISFRDGATYPESRYTTSFDFFAGSSPIAQSTDPYGDGGETEPGGGTGTFDDTGDDVDIPALPTTTAVDAGFITLFAPTAQELHNLATYMWSDLFDVNTFKKIFADPMQAILGLSIVPVNIPVIASRPVKVGNISTDVNLGVAGSQYIEVDCGTLDIKEFWGAYLDYDPYTKAEIYLPYIGTHPLAVDDIMGKPVHVVYHVDILSGACCAYVKCGGSVLYSFVGQCASSIPITGDNWTNVINGALSIAGSIGTMVATGGASAPTAIPGIAATAINSFKPTVEKSGAMGGTGGLMGVQTPYIILTRPRQALPRDQDKYTGYPSYITENLADLEGYTEVEHIHLENVPATESELSEIETLLKSGVIF